MAESRSKYPPVDTKNDALMVAENLRQPKIMVVKKEKITIEERVKLKDEKANAEPFSPTHRTKYANASKHKVKITIHFLNNKKEANFKTTLTTYIYKESAEEFLQSKIDDGYWPTKVYLNGKPFAFIPKPKNF